MSAVYPSKGGIMGSLEPQFYPHIQVRLYILGKKLGMRLTDTIGAGRNYKLTKISLGKCKIINVAQLGNRSKGIGKSLEIENITLSSVPSIQKLPPLFDLSADYLQSLLAYGGTSFDLDRRLPHNIFLISGSGTKLITKAAAPYPVLITMWTGETGIYRNSVDSLSIFLF